jgi:CheY-like chemotaxis protein
MTKSATPKNVVLYADDDMDDLDLVQDAFAQYTNDVEVVTVRDGSQAIAYLNNLSEYDASPCLIILDVNMPVINGKDVLKHIREMERFESVPVVLFTTSSMPLDKSFARSFNAGFVTKPLDIRQMEMITDQFISHCADEIKQKIRRQIK